MGNKVAAGLAAVARAVLTGRADVWAWAGVAPCRARSAQKGGSLAGARRARPRCWRGRPLPVRALPARDAVAAVLLGRGAAARPPPHLGHYHPPDGVRPAVLHPPPMPREPARVRPSHGSDDCFNAPGPPGPLGAGPLLCRPRPRRARVQDACQRHLLPGPAPRTHSHPAPLLALPAGHVALCMCRPDMGGRTARCYRRRCRHADSSPLFCSPHRAPRRACLAPAGGWCCTARCGASTPLSSARSSASACTSMPSWLACTWPSTPSVCSSPASSRASPTCGSRTSAC